MAKPFLSSFCIIPLITLLLCLFCLPVCGRTQQVSTGSCIEIPGAWDASRWLRNISAASSMGSDLQDTSTCQPGVWWQDPCEQDLFCPQHWVCFWVTHTHEKGLTNLSSLEAGRRWKARLCVCRSLGELKTRAGLWLYRGGTKLLLCHCCGRNKDQERGRTFWCHLKFGLQVSCPVDPMFSCPASRSETESLGIFRGSNARAHEGMWTVIIFPLCSLSHLIPLCKCSPCLVNNNWSQIKDLWCGQRLLSWFVSCKPGSCDNQALSAAQAKDEFMQTPCTSCGFWVWSVLCL